MKKQSTAKRPSVSVVNKRQLSEILGVSEETLSTWQRDGMPVKTLGSQGVSGEYEPATVIRWWIDRELEKVRAEQPRDRLARVQAERIEMDMARERGELVPLAEIAPAWTTHVVACRQELLRLPIELGARVRLAANDDTAIDMLTEAVEGALRKLSEDDEDGSGAADATERNPEALGAAA